DPDGPFNGAGAADVLGERRRAAERAAQPDDERDRKPDSVTHADPSRLRSVPTAWCRADRNSTSGRFRPTNGRRGRISGRRIPPGSLQTTHGTKTTLGRP